MISKNLNRILGLTALFVTTLHWTSSVLSAPGAISDSPLFTNSNVPPNVFFEVDDSGSMDWEVMTKPHWHYCAYDRNASGNTGSSDCGYYIESGLSSNWVNSSQYYNWQYETMYVFRDLDSLYYIDYCGNTIESCVDNEQTDDWRLFSSDLNTLYYNPNVDYTAWQGASFSNASFTGVRSDPQPNSDGYNQFRNLKNGISDGINTGFIYEVWEDSHGFSGSRPKRDWYTRRTTGSNGLVDLWDNHTRYYVKENEIVEQEVSYSLSLFGTLTEIISSTVTYNGSDTLNGKTIAEVQQNIANWYQYYRRRSFVAKAALGDVITANPENRYGLNFINNNSFLYNSGTSSFIDVPTGTSGFSSHNTSLLQGLYGLNWAANGTPLRQGLQRVGQYFYDDSSSAPIQYECQQNFAVLLTDGYWNGSDPSNTIGNADGDGYSLSVADVAKYYYDEDLSSKDDLVPGSILDPATYQHLVTFTVAFGVNGLLTDVDNNGWPEDTVDSSLNLAENGNWGNPFIADSPQKIDDLWHAAYNSKGSFVSASTPVEVSDALSSAIGSVGDRQGSNAAVSFNSSSLSSDTKLFLAKFNKQGNKWSGNLASYDLNPVTGDILTEDDPNDTSGNIPPNQILKANWNADEELDKLANPVSSRTIITYDKALVSSGNTGNGIPFRWANLTAAVKNDFRTEPNGTLSSDDVKAEARLNYLRGDKSNELSNKGTYFFRNRQHLLGDIIHSAPVFVKLPGEKWTGSSPFPSSSGNTYAAFKVAQASRQGVIYVGSNDGMLHGFSETNGAEIMAYIPSYLFSSASPTEGLHFLSDLNYQHRYYVDMSPTVSDVYIDKGNGSNWHSVLIGGSGSGGRGVFALDVTNPGQFSETKASDMVLWEFSDADDVDLGFVFSSPTVAMMNNGRWAAIFGNGYNNQGDGRAKLFIVFLDGGVDGVWTSGTDYIEIDTGVGSIVSSDCLNSSSDCNGLSSPHAVDIDDDLKIDRVYAGDIKGNLWAFDVSDLTATNWDVAGSGSPKPLFIASSNQPIMDKPIVVKHPDIIDSSSPSNAPNLLVFFGTGQYLSDSDITTIPPTQSFYGVWDHGIKEITPSDLFEQRFDTTTTFVDNDNCETELTDGTCVDTVNDLTNSLRVFNNDFNNDGIIDPDDPNETIDYEATGASHQGWKINFNLAGERVVVDPLIHDGLVFFNTTIPDATPCNAGGISYLMSVEQSNGGAPDVNDPAFDLNGDGKIDSKDLVKDSNDSSKKSAAVGQKFDLGLAAGSKVIGNNDSYKQYTPGSENGVGQRIVRGSSSPGRLSWEELR